jgi:hypothetical protein
MRKINRAPETRSGDDLHYVYTREEMRRETRYTDGRRTSSRAWSLHKIFLFDLLFLFIIGGVIVPFLINRNLSGKIDALSFAMELRRENEKEVFISIHIANTARETLSGDPIEIELVLGNSAPRNFSELPPVPGGERIIRYQSEGENEDLPVYCRILWKGQSLRLNGKI